ncbi:MAG: efflux RND transporter permease subunit, partial [Acidobacteriaceae bacterium]
MTGATPSPADSSFWLPNWARTIFFFTIVLAVAGAYLAFHIPISVFPQTNFPRIVIGVDNGVMPVEQMEVTITRPIEDAVNSVPGLQTVRSISSRGSAEIDLFFSWNVDMFQTLQLVDAAVARIQQSLPPTAQISTNRLTFATLDPIVGYALTSKTISQTRLWELATYELKPPINRLDGVSSVVIQGGQIPEYHVIPNTAKLIAASLTISDLVNAIQQTNLVQSPGLYEDHHQLILGLVGDQATNLEQLANISVKATASNVPIHLADVAQVVPGTEPVYTIVTSDGQPAVLLNVFRQPDSNTVAVADEVTAEIAQIRRALPPGVEIAPFYDQSHLVRESIA